MCGEVEFSLYGKEGDTLVEGVSNFKYMGRSLNQTDEDWQVVRQIFNRVRKVWGGLVKIIQGEGADTKVVAMFSKTVVQAVILFLS